MSTHKLSSQLKLYKKTNRIFARENSGLEFKESFNWESRDDYGHTIAGFANVKGGTIIFGIAEKPNRLVGLKDNAFENLSEWRITEYLNSTFAPEINFQKEAASLNGLSLGILRIFHSEEKPVIAIRNVSTIKDGTIYYRYNARTQSVRYPELRRIVDEIKSKERNDWRKLLREIAHIEVPKMLVGSPKRNKLNGSGVRVVLTNDPHATAVRFEEKDFLDKYPLTYKQLVIELKRRFNNFVLSKRFYDIKSQLAKNPNYSQTRFLNKRNPRSPRQIFYSREIIRAFDGHYKKK